MTGPSRIAIRATAALLAAAVVGSGLAACGSDEEAPPAPDYNASLKQAPPKLATLYAQGDALITGGQDAYEKTLDSVRGYPVVVNNWASWCGPCRTEFPWFQDAAAEHLDEVAFFGVDSDDTPEAYDTFMREYPVPYPSVEDPDKEFPSWVDEGLIGYPHTLFYDRDGELVYTHQGQYRSEEELDADIAKYALGS